MFSCPHTAPRCSTTAFLSATKPSYIYTPANHGPRAQLSVWRGPPLFYILIAVVLRAQCWGALCPPTPTTTSPTTATINPDAPCHIFQSLYSAQHTLSPNAVFSTSLYTWIFSWDTYLTVLREGGRKKPDRQRISQMYIIDRMAVCTRKPQSGGQAPLISKARPRKIRKLNRRSAHVMSRQTPRRVACG